MSSSDNSIERALSQLLDALAEILIPLEVTPARLAQVARLSFVKVSAKEAKMRSSGRPHLAKIAARTGLSRAEVKKIVVANFRAHEKIAESSPRALRVLKGWHTSKEYTLRGRPRSLKLEGQPPSFDALCRQFSGDIPRKVILDELVTRKRVTLSRGGRWISIAVSEARDPGRLRDKAALSFAAGFLTDALSSGQVIVKRRDKIAASPGVSDIYVEKAFSSRLSELLDQSPRVFVGRRARKRHILTAYTLVSRTQPRKTRR
jgi:hypothetical protein